MLIRRMGTCYMLELKPPRRASGLWFAGVHHEGHQPDQDRLDAPQGVPKLCARAARGRRPRSHIRSGGGQVAQGACTSVSGRGAQTKASLQVYGCATSRNTSARPKCVRWLLCPPSHSLETHGPLSGVVRKPVAHPHPQLDPPHVWEFVRAPRRVPAAQLSTSALNCWRLDMFD